LKVLKSLKDPKKGFNPQVKRDQQHGKAIQQLTKAFATRSHAR
jgi:hypothetical protein